MDNCMVLVVPQAIVIQIQLSPNSFSVVSLGSLGWTSHSSWILNYSIWSAKMSWEDGFSSCMKYLCCFVSPQGVCTDPLPVLLEGKTKKCQLCLFSVFPGYCFWVLRSLLRSQGFSDAFSFNSGSSSNLPNLYVKKCSTVYPEDSK
jgi:hypothetical protein